MENSLLIGGINDQAPMLIWTDLFKLKDFITSSSFLNHKQYMIIFDGFLYPLYENQPLYWLFLSKIIPLFASYAQLIFLFIICCLNIGFTYYLFKNSKHALIYSLIFSFSSYFWIRFGIHMDLMQIWLLPLFLKFFLELKNSKVNLKKSLFTSLIIVIAVLISNYLGFFIFVLSACLFFSEIVLNVIYDKKINLDFIKNYLMMFVISFSLLLLTLFPYVKANYFNKTENITFNPNQDKYTMTRSVEDFFYFSSRPWYFFTPSIKNPLLGNISTQFLNKISQSGNYLTDDYFADEHPSVFFGNIFLVTCVVFIVFLFKFASKNIVRESLPIILTIFILLLLMLPPYITISGYKIFTPGILMFKYFGMFRVTARFGIVILLLLLLLFSKAIDLVHTKHFVSSKWISVFMSFILIFTLIETYVPIKITYKPNINSVYSYINKISTEGSTFAVYPYKHTIDGLYALPVHQRVMLNPRGTAPKNMNPEKFTTDLKTTQGLQLLKDLNTDYIIVYEDSSLDASNFFNNSSLVEQVKVFEDNVVLYKLK